MTFDSNILGEYDRLPNKFPQKAPYSLAPWDSVFTGKRYYLMERERRKGKVN